MAAQTRDRDSKRKPGELASAAGSSGFIYYKGSMLMREGTGILKPATVGAGASSSRFLGVVENSVHRLTDSGTSQLEIRYFTNGEFEFAAQGTGASADIGKRAYIIDDQTVGTSVGFPSLPAGMITALPTTTTYRVLIDGAVGQNYLVGLSGFAYLN